MNLTPSFLFPVLPCWNIVIEKSVKKEKNNEIQFYCMAFSKSIYWKLIEKSYKISWWEGLGKTYNPLKVSTQSFCLYEQKARYLNRTIYMAKYE